VTLHCCLDTGCAARAEHRMQSFGPLLGIDMRTHRHSIGQCWFDCASGRPRIGRRWRRRLSVVSDAGDVSRRARRSCRLLSGAPCASPGKFVHGRVRQPQQHGPSQLQSLRHMQVQLSRACSTFAKFDFCLSKAAPQWEQAIVKLNQADCSSCVQVWQEYEVRRHLALQRHGVTLESASPASTEALRQVSPSAAAGSPTTDSSLYALDARKSRDLFHVYGPVLLR